MLELVTISKRYNKDILKGFSYKFTANKLVVISGPSGSGKSTLLNIIGGIERPDSGNIFYNKNSHKFSKNFYRTEICFLFQNFLLIEERSIRYNLSFACHKNGLSKKENDQQMIDILRQLNINHSLTTPVITLSGGEKQRIAMARCFLKDSHILLADEPTGSLDSSNRDVILTFLLRLRDLGKCIIVASHDEEIIKLADDVIYL